MNPSPERRLRGFTLVEVIIASGIFSLLLIGILGIFRSGSTSFNIGTWKVHTQKNAQIFLNRLKETLEKANNAEYVPRVGDIAVTRQPIYIGEKWLNKSAPLSNGNVMIFSICRSCIENNPDLNIPGANGNWTGVVMLATSGRTLELYRTGSVNRLPPSAPVRAGPPDLTRFAPGFEEGNFLLRLPDVASLTITYSMASATSGALATSSTIGVTIELRRYDGKKPTETRITESILANLLNSDQEVLPLP